MTAPAASRRFDVYGFFFVACALTWLCDLPWMLACARGVEPPSYALPLTALGAFGPTIAAVGMGAVRGDARAVFRRWGTSPLWIAAVLLMPAAIHLPATLLERALGGSPAQWFYFPNTPQLVAALIVFSVGEEFGWRGYAHDEVTRHHGVVPGALLLGAVWGLWHFGMLFTPSEGAPALSKVVFTMAELALYSVVVAWFFEGSGRSMAVALAFHAGGHLDNVNRAPEDELRLRALRFLVLLAFAAVAARVLSSRERGARGELS